MRGVIGSEREHRWEEKERTYKLNPIALCNPTIRTNRGNPPIRAAVPRLTSGRQKVAVVEEMARSELSTTVFVGGFVRTVCKIQKRVVLK